LLTSSACFEVAPGPTAVGVTVRERNPAGTVLNRKRDQVETAPWTGGRPPPSACLHPAPLKFRAGAPMENLMGTPAVSRPRQRPGRHAQEMAERAACGAEGERKVGTILESFAPDWHVLHGEFVVSFYVGGAARPGPFVST
jgi:hypothetical protein